MQKNFSTLTLLYVEDEESIRRNATEYLGRIFATVLEAGDGVEALRVYRECKPDIIISDIQMPRMGGLEFARQIRLSDKSTPIIIATAHTQQEYLLKAVELQLIKYIIKPITAAKLQEALTLAHAHLHQNNIIMISQNTLYDSLNQTLFIDDAPVKLTANELLFLNLLVKNHQRTVTYQEIENYVWVESAMSMDALRTLVRVVRKKLRCDCIENVSGIGYRLHLQG